MMKMVVMVVMVQWMLNSWEGKSLILSWRDGSSMLIGLRRLRKCFFKWVSFLKIQRIVPIPNSKSSRVLLTLKTRWVECSNTWKTTRKRSGLISTEALLTHKNNWRRQVRSISEGRREGKSICRSRRSWEKEDSERLKPILSDGKATREEEKGECRIVKRESTSKKKEESPL